MGNLKYQFAAAFVALSGMGPAHADTARFFTDSEKRCSENVPAQFILIESQMRATRDPRSSRTRTINLRNYCACYYRTLRRQAGDALAERGTQFNAKPPLSNSEVMAFSKASDRSVEACVTEQMPVESASGAAVAEPGLSPQFQKVFAAQFVIGKGIGGVEIGLPVSRLNEIMGPTNAVRKSKDYDEYFYGPNLLELTVRISPPGSAGKVQYISVNYLYRGTTSNGIHMSEVFESVKLKMLPRKPSSEDRHAGYLRYDSGSQFGFSDYNGGILQRITAFEPQTASLKK